MFLFQYKIDCRITIELLDTENEENDKNVQNSKTWSNYVDRLSNPVAANVTNSVNQSSGVSSSSTKNLCDETSLAIKEENLDCEMVSVENKNKKYTKNHTWNN